MYYPCNNKDFIFLVSAIRKYGTSFEAENSSNDEGRKVVTQLYPGL
jgi:hypothetical protein